MCCKVKLSKNEIGNKCRIFFQDQNSRIVSSFIIQKGIDVSERGMISGTDFNSIVPDSTKCMALV